MTLEKNIMALEDALANLENEDVNLDEAVNTYSSTLELAKETLTKLDDIQDKIKVLQQKNGELIESSLHLKES